MLVSSCPELTTVLFRVARHLTRVDAVASLATEVIPTLVASVTSGGAGAVFLYEENSGSLAARSAHGYRWAPLSRIRIKPGETMSGKAYALGRQQVFASPGEVAAAMAEVDAGTMALYLEATGGRLPSASVCSPFSLKGKRLGVFTVEEFSQRKTQAFAAAAPAFLQVAADLIALGTGCFHRETEESTVSERERDRMRSELIAVLSHEMRTPLASIKGYVTALLRDDVEWDAGTRREFLEIIDRETDTLTQVITEILDASMLEEGGLELNKEPLLLPRLVEKVVNEVCPRAPQHRFLVCFPPDFPIVAGDRLRIEQVLRNLLDNAVKYSDGGLIVLRGEARGDEVVVSVADQGVGIKPDHLNRLFERFYRIKNEGRRAVVGTGLGLPIARDIVEKHGGRIWASSQVGKGTTFFFTLPCDSSAHLPGTT